MWSRHLWTPSKNIEFCTAAVRRTPLNCGYMAVYIRGLPSVNYRALRLFVILAMRRVLKCFRAIYNARNNNDIKTKKKWFGLIFLIRYKFNLLVA